MSFEEHINRNLKNYQSDVDPNLIWENIASEIPSENEKKRRFFFIFLIFGALAFGTSHLSPDTIHGSSASLVINERVSDSDNNKYIIKGFQTFPLRTKDNQFEIINPTLSIQKQNNTLKSNTTKHNIVQVIRQAPKADASPSYGNYLIENYSQTKKIPKQNTITAIEPEIINHNTKQKERETFELAAIDMVMATVEMKERREKKIVAQEDNGDTKESTNKNKKAEFFGGVTFGWGSTKNSISSKSPIGNSYANELSEINTRSFIKDYSADLQIRFPSGFFVKSGIIFQETSTKYISAEKEHTPYSGETPELDRTPPSPDEDISKGMTFSSKPKYQNSQGSNPKDTPSSYTSSGSSPLPLLSKQVSLPISVGYLFGKGKLKMGIETGLLINIVTKCDGDFYFPNRKFSKIEKNSASPYKKNQLLKFNNQISIVYDINDKISFNLSGNYRFNPFSITKKDASFVQKQQSGGASIGMMFNLSN